MNNRLGEAIKSGEIISRESQQLEVEWSKLTLG